MILVTGATGTVGSAVVAALRARHMPVRAMVRPGHQTAPADGVEFAEASFDDAVSLGRALDGIDTMYLVSPGVRELESAAIGAAKDRSLTRVVKQSVLGADETLPSAILSTHALIEGDLIDSGVPYTILRPNFFMQNFVTQMAQSIQTASTISAPAADATLSFVDVRDIADVAVAALTTPDFESETLDLTGPAALSYADAAALISKAAGRQIRYSSLSDEDAKAQMNAAGLPAAYVDAMIALYQIVRAGGMSGVSDGVAQATGHPARTFEAFAGDHADAFAPR